jgi:hypothetical protein
VSGLGNATIWGIILAEYAEYAEYAVCCMLKDDSDDAISYLPPCWLTIVATDLDVLISHSTVI